MFAGIGITAASSWLPPHQERLLVQLDLAPRLAQDAPQEVVHVVRPVVHLVE